MTATGPVNFAYMRNLLTDRDFRDLLGLYHAFRDDAKSGWFDNAARTFRSRYADPVTPNRVNA